MQKLFKKYNIPPQMQQQLMASSGNGAAPGQTSSPSAFGGNGAFGGGGGFGATSSGFGGANAAPTGGFVEPTPLAVHQLGQVRHHLHLAVQEALEQQEPSAPLRRRPIHLAERHQAVS